jgi:hypothetical protein
VKEKPTVASPYFSAFPSDRIHKQTKDVNVLFLFMLVIPVNYTSKIGVLFGASTYTELRRELGNSDKLIVSVPLCKLGIHRERLKRLRWSRGSRRIFQGEKILSMPSFGGEVKPLVPCRRFAACKIPFKWSRIRNLLVKLPAISGP